MKNYSTPVKNLFYYLLLIFLYWHSPLSVAEETTIHRDAWYLSQADDSATIQMSGHSTEAGAIAYINEAGLTGEIGYYQTQYKNKPWFAVTYGSYGSLDDARSQLGSLPENLQSHAPWPRTFKAIKSLIEAAIVATDEADKTAGMEQVGDALVKDDTLLDASWEEGQDAYDSGDFAVAFKIWNTLAKEGDPLSQFNLGVMYSRGEGTRKNGKRALEWYMRSAEQGYAPAQFNLGAIYIEGSIVDADQKKAAAWWQLAAEQEFVQAQFNLASLYCRGIGVSRDREQCKFWYGKAATNGDTHAQKMLDHILASENTLKADELTVELTEIAVKESDSKENTVNKTEVIAAPDVGLDTSPSAENDATNNAPKADLESSLVAAAEESLMEEKLEEERLSNQEKEPVVRKISAEERVMLSKAQAAFTRSNYMKAHDIWLPLAESGIAEAQYSLGFLYQSGWGPERDLLQAVAWYTSASEQDEARAQFNLGILLLNGEDNVEKDTETGILWLTRSADANNTRAKEFLINVYKNGKYGIEPSKEKVEYWKSR